jgi:lysophospholipase L1-like esterase
LQVTSEYKDLIKKYLLFNALGLGLLGCSVFINFLLYNRVNKYYLELNQTRLDPLGLSYYPVNSPAVAKPGRFRVVFFGDSRAADWLPPKIDRYEFINRGIPSQTSVQTIDRLSAHVSPLKPDLVIIQVGVNDLKTIALFPERKQAIITNCQVNIKQIIQASRKLGAVVMVTTILPAGEVPLERKPFWSDQIGLAIKEVNTYIKTLADDKTIVFDTYALLADRRGLMLPQYRSDELHFNQQGYTILNQELARQLAKIDRLIHKPVQAQLE